MTQAITRQQFRGALICIGAMLLLAGANAVAIEEPKYEVVKTYLDFELRRYAPYLVAETEVSGDFDEVGNRAFRILAAYIFGENRAQEKMEMTRPRQPASGSRGRREDGDDGTGHAAAEGRGGRGHVCLELRHAVPLYAEYDPRASESRSKPS